MAATVGSLKVDLTLESAAFAKGLDGAAKQLAVTQKSFDQLGSKFTDIGAKLSLGLTAPLAAFAARGISEAQQTAAAMGQVNAALASMGPLAGRSAEQLQAAANAFEGASLYEADEILTKVTANMLTFGNISGKAFDQAQQSAIDLATRMGGDLQSATLLVGKALNDPVKGMSALGRAGIQFSDSQKAAIVAMTEAGNVAGAQGIILGELKKQFGGAAEAAQNTDPWNKVKDAFNGVAETVGNALIPVMPAVANAIATVANAFTSLSPETQKWLLIAGGTVAALGPVLTVLGTLTSSLGAILPLVTKLGPVWTALKVAMTAARVAALATLPALTPLLAPLAAIGAAVGAAYLAWKNWDKITAIAKAVYTGVKTWLMDKLGKIIDWVVGKVRELNAPFEWVHKMVVGNSWVPDMVTGVGMWMAKLPDLMGKPVDEATKRVNKSFAELNGTVAAAMPEIGPLGLPDDAEGTTGPLTGGTGAGAPPSKLLGTLNAVRDILGQIGDTGRKSFTGIASRILDTVIPALQTLQDKSATTLDKMAAVGSVFGDLVGLIFGKKAGRIAGAVAQAGVQIYGALSGRSFGGYRAGGGPVVPGKTYVVGENGPEFLTVGARGFVTPPKGNNDNGGRAGVVRIVPSRYFDVVVDQRAAGVAEPMARQAAVMGAAGGSAAIQRQASRRFP